jgi:hypothetical protein
MEQRSDGREGDRPGKSVIPALHGGPLVVAVVTSILGIGVRDLTEPRRDD